MQIKIVAPAVRLKREHNVVILGTIIEECFYIEDQLQKLNLQLFDNEYYEKGFVSHNGKFFNDLEVELVVRINKQLKDEIPFSIENLNLGTKILDSEGNLSGVIFCPAIQAKYEFLGVNHEKIYELLKHLNYRYIDLAVEGFIYIDKYGLSEFVTPEKAYFLLHGTDGILKDTDLY